MIFSGLPSLQLSEIWGYDHKPLCLYGKDQQGNIIKERLDHSLDYITNDIWDLTKTSTKAVPLSILYSALDTYKSSNGFFLVKNGQAMGQNITLNRMDYTGTDPLFLNSLNQNRKVALFKVQTPECFHN